MSDIPTTTVAEEEVIPTTPTTVPVPDAVQEIPAAGEQQVPVVPAEEATPVSGGEAPTPAAI